MRPDARTPRTRITLVPKRRPASGASTARETPAAPFCSRPVTSRPLSQARTVVPAEARSVIARGPPGTRAPAAGAEIRTSPAPGRTSVNRVVAKPTLPGAENRARSTLRPYRSGPPTGMRADAVPADCVTRPVMTLPFSTSLVTRAPLASRMRACTAPAEALASPLSAGATTDPSPVVSRGSAAPAAPGVPAQRAASRRAAPTRADRVGG